MTLGAMLNRLLVIARERVGNGEITESHLARLMGISQSHTHNVLKGSRKLSSELADEILSQLGLTAYDLLDTDAPVSAMPFRPVPLLADRIGCGAMFNVKRTSGSAQVPAQAIAPLQRPIAALLDEDAALSPRFERDDLVLIEQSIAARRKIEKDSVYLVMTGDGPRLRYVRRSEGHLFLATEECLRHPARWKRIRTGNLLNVICGRVVWLSRQFPMGSGR